MRSLTARATLAGLFFICSSHLLSLRSHAAEFPWFKVMDSYQGYVEFVEGTQTSRNIYVLPVLGLPGTAYYHNTPWGFGAPTANTGIEIADNGDLFLNFKIHTNTSHLPSSFKQDVINYIAGKGFNFSKYATVAQGNYLVTFVKPQQTKVKLYLDNEEFETLTLTGILDANFNGKFRIPASKVNLIRLGKFDVKIEYDFPYQNFSSISINIKEELLTKIKIDVFREIIQSTSSSSGGFFIWKWQQQTHRVVEKNRVNFDASNSNKSDISIVYRDATPAMLDRISTVLGFYATTKQDLVKAHNEAYAKAMNSKNLALGDMHKKYIEAVQADDIGKSIDVLKAAAALSDGNLFTFLASGVAFSDASSSSYSSFHGIKRVNITTTSQLAYNEIMINTVNARLSTAGMRPPSMTQAINDAYRHKNVAIFNVQSYMPLYTANWIPAYFQAAINNDMSTMKYLTTYFTPIAQVNAINGNSQNTALHIAAQNGNVEMVKLLVEFGVNLKMKNRYEETARDIAVDKGFTAIADYLKSKESNLGSARVKFQLPQGFTLESVNYYGLELPYMEGLDLRDKVRVFNSSDISFDYHPGIYQISFIINYRNSYGVQQSSMITNVYKIRAGGLINYTENLIFKPEIQSLSNNATTYLGTMVDPIYLDN
ncbi:ankyrin repeat domain-containing protein [Paraflavitalea sp. CAU 1676]|uniref:ankyrin repeat domain-containing protein n=1 Tax=Paraflavitalea sp. CAU 1676 TaxID=3032598 RepID=UPI0023D996FA|nr:ankyrin repeat domain-containing protein [Paraflavitalea sp. CAU 1676]MDF2193440.1 ankyrin repeat domain-containing protein [Paraflavitalea sp. CAU 1676]